MPKPKPRKRRKLGFDTAVRIGKASRSAGSKLRARNSRLVTEERIARLEDMERIHQRRLSKSLGKLQAAQNRVDSARNNVQSEQSDLLKVRRQLRKANEGL